MSYTDFFAGKRITVMGLGLLGRGVGDVEFLAKCGAQVVVTDKKNDDQLAASVERLGKYPNVTLRLGGHDLRDFTDTDLVIKAAGVRLDAPEILAAREAGVQVAMSTALCAHFATEVGAKIVGVTGTRGKSSVSHMVYHVLVHAGRRTHLGGNIRGLSTLAMLPLIRADDVVVLELDSWQLQGFGDLQISPNVAIFTNLMPDHQDYYQSMDEYFSDKTKIFTSQHTGDTLIVGKTIAQQIRSMHPPVEPIVPPDLNPDWLLQIPGEHNRDNASLAAAALAALGMGSEEIRDGLETFQGVEGRLQLIDEKNGIRIYNDNNATTPEATMAAIKALDEGKKNIILIMGGSDKGLDMTALWPEILEKCKYLYFLKGTGTASVRTAVPHAPEYDSLEGAFKAALSGAEPGDTILFSPAFASFGMFKNEYDRNDQFLQLVQKTI